MYLLLNFSVNDCAHCLVQLLIDLLMFLITLGTDKNNLISYRTVAVFQNFYSKTALYWLGKNYYGHMAKLVFFSGIKLFCLSRWELRFSATVWFRISWNLYNISAHTDFFFPFFLWWKKFVWYKCFGIWWVSLELSIFV